MKKQEIDYILSQMLQSHEGVSDLNFTVGKPLQVETYGELVPVDMEPKIKKLTPYQTEMLGLNLINLDRRLTEALATQGSCDLSYHLGTEARFRVNIFSRTGNYSLVLRKLETKAPPINEFNIPASLYV